MNLVAGKGGVSDRSSASSSTPPEGHLPGGAFSTFLDEINERAFRICEPILSSAHPESFGDGHKRCKRNDLHLLHDLMAVRLNSTLGCSKLRNRRTGARYGSTKTMVDGLVTATISKAEVQRSPSLHA
jgi:hypothetical protein